MKLEQFAKVCMVNVVQEHEGAHRLWLYTRGLAEFGLPELELRNVHPFWAADASHHLTTWAHAYTNPPEQIRPAAGAEFQVATLDGLHVVGTLKQSTADHWQEHPTGCLEIDLLNLEIGCACCECGGGAGTVH